MSFTDSENAPVFDSRPNHSTIFSKFYSNCDHDIWIRYYGLSLKVVSAPTDFTAHFLNSEDNKKNGGKNSIFKKFVGSENSKERSDKTIKETYFKSTYTCVSLPLQLEIKRDRI